MESVLTEENLCEWEGMDEKRLIEKVSSIIQSAITQMKFSYSKDFKRKLSSMMCLRWTNGSSPLRKGFCVILRCLCRDQTSIDDLLSREIMENVIGSTGLSSCSEADLPDDERLEAVKCLINAFFHHESSISIFTDLSCLDGLSVATMREKDGEKRFLLLRLIFIVSSRLDQAQKYWRNDTSLVHFLCEESLNWEELTKNADEALKVLSNLFRRCHKKTDEVIIEECLQMTKRLLLNAPRGSSQIKNTLNLLFYLPINVDLFYPRLEEATSAYFSFDGRDMRIAEVVMNDLEYQLHEDKSKDVEDIFPYFTFLINCSMSCKEVRRYCRIKIIPPLSALDVERPPEKGNTMRNKIIRLMKSSSQPRDLAAQFMFILCKKSVNRLIKYTGLGNAAGFLANEGLFGKINEGRRESDSEDSETEEYKEVEERVNPVTGYMLEERPDPMEGMSEEQKEYEVMKLVHAMDRLLAEGIIQPSAIGSDGRPTTVSHVLELLNNVKTPEGSDSDCD